MTEGHAQELKTQALAMKVGKRLRVMISDNNAGIDDSLIGGVIDEKYDGYRLVEQWTSYGWNVFVVRQRQRLRAGRRRAQDDGGLGSERPASDGAHRQDHEGLLAGRGQRQDSGSWRSGGRLPEPPLRDEDELGVLRRAGQTFEQRYGVEFQGIRRARRRTRASGWSSSRPTWTSRCRCSTGTGWATGSPITWSTSARRCATICRCACR